MRLTVGCIEAEGEDDFVRSVYLDFKERLHELDIMTTEARRSLHNLLDEARISLAWEEYARAHKLYSLALEQCPKGIGNSLLAEILEGMDHAQVAMDNGQRELPALQAAVDAEPESAENRFRLALMLSRLGREDEALTEYEAALSNPDGLCADCFRDLWNNIGWYYYRQGKIQEALRWFDQTYAVANSDEIFGEGRCSLAMENKILSYSALGMSREAAATAREYTRRYGRLPFPERRALAKLGIEADTIYVEHRHGVSDFSANETVE